MCERKYIYNLININIFFENEKHQPILKYLHISFHHITLNYTSTIIHYIPVSTKPNINK